MKVPISFPLLRGFQNMSLTNHGFKVETHFQSHKLKKWGGFKTITTSSTLVNGTHLCGLRVHRVIRKRKGQHQGNQCKSEADKGSQSYLIYYKEYSLKNRTDWILKPGMVHAKMYSTIHKSALSQQINKSFLFSFSSRTMKESPLVFASRRRESHGQRQYREQRRTNTGEVEEWGGAWLWGGRKGTVTSTRTEQNKTKQKIFWGPTKMQDDTEHLGTGWGGDGELRREWRKRPTPPVDSRNWEWGAGRGEGSRATVQSKAKFPLK